MKEVGAVIDTLGKVIHWHDPNGSSSGALPDSVELWDVIWRAHQERRFAGFAHTHPGDGLPGPSHTDITTFRAIEQALGVRPLWWIASSSRLVVLRAVPMLDTPKLMITENTEARYTGYMQYAIEVGFGETVLAPWVSELRTRSQY